MNILFIIRVNIIFLNKLLYLPPYGNYVDYWTYIVMCILDSALIYQHSTLFEITTITKNNICCYIVVVVWINIQCYKSLWFGLTQDILHE